MRCVIAHNDLYIVDNSNPEHSVKKYLNDWCGISRQMDIATGYFEIGGLLELDGKWQSLEKIRIILGSEITKRTVDRRRNRETEEALLKEHHESRSVMMNKRNIAISENQDVSEKLSILIDAAVREIPGIEKIYLFGSYAYGKPSSESDLDLMVITDKEIDDAILSVTEIRYNTWGKVGVFDMLVYSEKVFNDRKEKYNLENKVFNEGKIIYERI